MLTVRPAAERGVTELPWLDSRHSFSFGEYRDRTHMGFSSLRVINEDVVAPSTGFPPHGHADMEILTWIVSGSLTHRDSMGNTSTIRPGDVQLMSAGTGVQHSEWNGDAKVPVHLLQIWILPSRRGDAPRYQERHLDASALEGRLALLVSPDGRDGSLVIGQDARVFAGRMAPGARLEHVLTPGRSAWVQVVKGRVQLGEQALAAGDGAALRGASVIPVTADDASEILLFDLP